MNMGVVYTEGWVHGQLPRSCLDDALACHVASKDIWRQRGETERELRVWNNMGATYKAMERLDEALDAYRTALLKFGWDLAKGGMVERAELLSGRLWAGPSESGWAVECRLPMITTPPPSGP